MKNGVLAAQGGFELPLKVLESGKGFYLGTADENGPISRESEEYWGRAEDATHALSGKTPWTQRSNL